MLRIIQNFNLLKISAETINNSYTNLQTVRWRKPRWIPVAKSKKFRVPPRRVIPEEERLEILRLYNNYRNHIKSIRRYLTKKFSVMFQASLDPEEQRRIFNEDFARCVAINDEWNVQQKVLREKHLQEKLEEELAFARNRIEKEILQEEKKLELIEEIVRKEKSVSEAFITADTIDAAIEKAFAQEADYNFAIDLNGEKIMGREGKPVVKEEKISMKQ